MSDGKSSSGAGIGFMNLLLLLFIALKLCKVIDWSWWIVLWPLWLQLGFVAVLLLILFIALIAAGK